MPRPEKELLPVSTMFVPDLDPGLFAPARATNCACGTATYCPACGTWEPASSDPEVIDAVSEDARSRRVAARVIRKHLEH